MITIFRCGDVLQIVRMEHHDDCVLFVLFNCFLFVFTSIFRKRICRVCHSFNVSIVNDTIVCAIEMD